MPDIKEEWIAVKDFPDYAVSNHGRVKNLVYDRLLKPRANSYGHMRVTLTSHGIKRDFYLHHLVAQAFMKNYRPRMYLKPADGDWSNCHVYNLRLRRGARMGLLNKPGPDKVYVRQIRIVETGQVFRNVETCAAFLKTDPSNIYKVLREERPHHLGLTFERVRI